MSDNLWNHPDGGNHIWYTNGPAFWIGNAGAGTIPSVGDFNGDGVTDILWHSPANGSNANWLMKRPVQLANGQWEWVLSSYAIGASAPAARAVS